jgi:hypothetical protein
MGSWQKFAVALFFAAAQLFAVAHAGTSGEGPHDHDGVICAIGANEHEQSAVLPPTSFDLLPPAPAPTLGPVTFEVGRKTCDAERRPPPTGPPGLTD